MNKRNYALNHLRELDGVSKEAIIKERIAQAEYNRESRGSQFKVLEGYDLYNQEAFVSYIKERNRKEMTIHLYCDEEKFDITVIFDNNLNESITFKGENGWWKIKCDKEDSYDGVDFL